MSELFEELALEPLTGAWVVLRRRHDSTVPVWQVVRQVHRGHQTVTKRGVGGAPRGGVYVSAERDALTTFYSANSEDAVVLLLEQIDSLDGPVYWVVRRMGERRLASGQEDERAEY
jgi:hypothetical protein